MRFRGTLAARVTLLATVAVGLSVAFLAAAAYLTVKHQLIATLDQSLLERATAASKSSGLVELTRRNVPTWVLGAADVRIAILSSDGTVVESPGEEDVGRINLSDAELVVAQSGSGYSLRTVRTSGGLYRVAAVPGNEAGTALILAQSLESNQDALSELGVVLTVFGLLGVIAAGFAGWAVARNGLRPVRLLSDAVDEIARTEKLDPIEVQGNDEIARLATAFNAMLGALAASRDRQRQLVADAGHELRTPLTSMRTNLDLLIQAEARGGLSAESRAELMDDVRFQIEELTTLIGDLTELAREEPVPAQLEPVDLAEVVEHALDRVRRRASGLHYDVELEPWRVTGEATSLERAVTNLLDNAAKWSPPLGVVTVRLKDGTLYVADQGRGIAAEDLPYVFERFYRSPESRTLPGSGLGLSIVRRIVERHNGAVRAGSAPGVGAAFWLRLPPCDPDLAGPFPAAAKKDLSVNSATEGTLDP